MLKTLLWRLITTKSYRLRLQQWTEQFCLAPGCFNFLTNFFPKKKKNLKTFFSPKQPELLHQTAARHYIKVLEYLRKEQKEKTGNSTESFLMMQEDVRTNLIYMPCLTSFAAYRIHRILILLVDLNSKHQDLSMRMFT